MYKQSFWKRPQAVLLAGALAIGIGGASFAGVEHLARQHAALELNLAAADQAPSRTGFAPVVRKAAKSAALD